MRDFLPTPARLPVDPSHFELSSLRLDAAGHQQAILHKTVDTFAAIMQRRLWLKNSNRVTTDGTVLCLPIHSVDAYLRLEELLAHLLFRTDVVAKRLFVTEYVKQVEAATTSAGQPVDAARLASGLDCLIDTLEHHRVVSLWRRLYEGSYERMRARERADAQAFVTRAHTNILTYACLLGTAIDIPAGPLDRYRNVIEDAYRKVEGTDFAATLLVAKWLVVSLVSEVVRGAGNPLEQAKVVHAPSTAPEGPNDPQDGPKEPDQGQGRGEAQRPPGSLQERAGALQELLETLGDKATTRNQTQVRVEESKFSGNPSDRSKKPCRSALGLDVGDREAMQTALQRAREQAAQQTDRVKESLLHPSAPDNRLRRDAPAKVVFRDVVSTEKPTPLMPEDQATVDRLRSLFALVMGQRSSDLDEIGSRIDIGAYIEQATSRRPGPCFEIDTSGRGFKVLLLLDRSDSMQDEKKAQAERACRVLGRALDYPFVNLHVWGFQSVEQGQVDITRFDRRLEVFDTEHVHVGGMTPLHIALQIAGRFLELGDETRHIIAITDGYPTHRRRNGQVIGTGQLMLFVRDAVRHNRQIGVNTCGVMIGYERQARLYYDTNEKQLQFMFGNPKFWRQVTPAKLGRDLVRLVANLFLSYLAGA